MSTRSGHSHAATGKKLQAALALTVVILAVELIAGFFAHSLALLSDAGHVFTDIAALGLAWFATTQADRPADARKTYGYHRTGILAALANALTLLLIVAAIAYEAVLRLQHPVAVTPWPLFVAAGVGIAVNVGIAASLHGEHTENLNVRAAWLHVVGDVAAGVGVVAAGIVIVLTHWYPIDPILSLLIAALIARGAWSILRDTVDILMESTPRGLDMAGMVRDMVRVPGVRDVHDLHVWSIAGGMSALSAHLQVDDRPLSQCGAVVSGVSGLLQRRYGISHATLQLECGGCETKHIFCEMICDGHTVDQRAQRHEPAISGLDHEAAR
jgi:cobalt-zinc-cadmium efflux system protein